MMSPNTQNQAMEGALAPQGGGSPEEAMMMAEGVPPNPADMQSMPGIPPELMAIAKALGLDLNDPNALAVLMQILGAGGGGQMGPMAGSPEAAPQGPPMGPPLGPQGPPMPPMGGGQ